MKIRLAVTSSGDGQGFTRYDAEIDLDRGVSLETVEAHVRTVLRIMDDQMASGWQDEDDDEGGGAEAKT